LASKSFTTQETITNASAARDWLIAGLPLGADWRQHMVAATTNAEAAHAFGIHTQDILSVPVWVGGRYSIWSAIGLTPMIVIGPPAFTAFLAGGADMDQHFLHAPFAQNLPALLALLGIWNINFLDAHTLAVLPYAHALTQLPAYLQQLDMESNGKSIDRDGRAIDYATAPVVWGAAGTVGQHSFHQLLHQGTLYVPCEFITVDTPMGDVTRHQILNANARAQAQALALGRPAEGLKPWQLHPGNRPSLTLRLTKLDAHTLGALIALYEHKVFMQGCIWNINSFDQFGVEYGKQLAAEQLRPL
jgi:glucose-6-phosphate isomerase